MVCDKNGQPLQVGDRVLVECVVTKVVDTQRFANVHLETAVPMPPTSHRSYMLLNSRQTVKAI